MKTLIHKLKVWLIMWRLERNIKKWCNKIETKKLCCAPTTGNNTLSVDDIRDSLEKTLTPPANEADATKKAVAKAKKKVAKKSSATKTRTTKRKSK